MNLHDEVVRRMTWAGPEADGPETLLNREWLVTNGLGGSASGTVAGVVTRRQHGLLVAALPAPHGRTVMLSHLYERVRLPDGAVMAFGGDEREGDALEVPAMNHLVELRLEQGLPIWRYEGHLQASYIYQTSAKSQLVPAENDLVGTQGAFGLVNLSAEVESGAYTFQLFINNALDKQGDLYKYTECSTLLCGSEHYTVITPPRLIGVKFAQKF